MDMSTVFNIASIGLGSIAGITAAISLVKGTFYTVEQEHQGLVTRFDRHVRTNEEPGLKVKIPFIEKVHEISMQEFQATENLETKTTDNLFVSLPIAIHFQVSDPAIFKFKKGNAVDLMKKVVSAAVREYTSGKTFQELYDERQEIKQGVLDKVEEQVGSFGLQINDIIIDEPQASAQVESDFDGVRSAQLKQDAAEYEAKADYIRKVESARADKDRDLLRGEGAAGYRKKIFDQYAEQIDELVTKGTPREEAVSMMIKIMELDTWREVGEKGNSFVITGSGDSSGDFTNRFKEMLPVAKVLDSQNPVPEQNNAGPTADMAGPG
jgi:regulator of protease activity HflC (stomatin/prohibitin superfamily)